MRVRGGKSDSERAAGGTRRRGVSLMGIVGATCDGQLGVGRRNAFSLGHVSNSNGVHQRTNQTTPPELGVVSMYSLFERRKIQQRWFLWYGMVWFGLVRYELSTLMTLGWARWEGEVYPSHAFACSLSFTLYLSFSFCRPGWVCVCILHKCKARLLPMLLQHGQGS